MQEISTRIWQEHGTSIVWDADVAHAVAQPPSGCSVSLHEALSWATGMPATPGSGIKTVVVTGLQAALDVLGTSGSATVLQRLRRLVREQSRHWPDAGMIFLVQDPGRFRVHSATGSLLMLPRTPGQPEIDLGNWLWGGNLDQVCSVVATKTDSRGRSTASTVGYWVRRVS